jgi:HlyD family secretion protein
MKSRIGIAIVLIGIVAAVSYKQVQGTTETSIKSQVKTVVVTSGNLEERVEATGRVEANLEVSVKSKASGTITSVPVEFSDYVTKGQLLVQLDPIDEERSVSRARVALVAAKAKYTQAVLNLEIARQNLANEERRAKADLASTKAQAVEAAANLKRANELLAGSFLSQEDMDAASSTSAKCEAALEAAYARIAELEAQRVNLSCLQHSIEIAAATVEEKEIAYAETQTRLKETRIVAPIDGVITANDAQIGLIVSSGISNVGGGSSLMSIADLSRCFVEASVDESDIGKVKVGQKVVVTADAFSGKRFTGRVDRVAAKGNIESNVVTFVVQIEVTGQGVSLLKPEMTSNVSIITAQATDAVLVPALAIIRRKGKSFVRVVENGVTQRRAIETGIGDLENTEVTFGLKVGEVIVVEEASKVSKWRKNRGEEQKDKRGAHKEGKMAAGIMGGKGKRR